VKKKKNKQLDLQRKEEELRLVKIKEELFIKEHNRKEEEKIKQRKEEQKRIDDLAREKMNKEMERRNTEEYKLNQLRILNETTEEQNIRK